MKVVIAGGHGQIALRLSRILSARGEEVTGLIRNSEHVGDVRDAGAAAVVCDLESASKNELAAVLAGADAVVFAAGAGPGSGAARKLTVDRDGAVKLMDAAKAAGTQRYVMISSSGVESATSGDSVFEVYLRAKGDADAALSASGLDWTILRPGALTDEAGTGLVRLDTVPFRGSVARDDVAAVIAAVLADGRSIREILYLSSGTQTIGEALDTALASG